MLVASDMNYKYIKSKANMTQVQKPQNAYGYVAESVVSEPDELRSDLTSQTSKTNQGKRLEGSISSPKRRVGDEVKVTFGGEYK